MKGKYKFIIIFVGLLVLAFLLMGLMKGNNYQELVFHYPILDENVTYENRIFDDKYVHEINILISDNDWNDLINNPLNETKYKTNIVIDGITFEKVSLKPKGNSSLAHVAEGPKGGPASSRFSFKIDFGKYVEDQSYYGLDVLNLNNIFGDSTYLNDYLSYDIFKQVGIPTPLKSFVYIKINGNDFGLYLAVEEISQSFLKRNKLVGNLYKPEKYERDDMGVSLQYRGDDPLEYASIFGTRQNDITKDDEIRMIKSIKNLNELVNIDESINVDEVIKYFAAHNFLLSYDSYTGKSLHNYYLLEKDGLLSIYPWDYNLAFGRFNMLYDINKIVNFGIDSPLDSPEEKIEDKDRPLWNFILQDEKYLKKYHEIMSKLIKEYFESNKYESVIDSIYQVILPYRRADASAFYTVAQTKKGISSLKEFCKKRAESIRLQLNGKLATITDKQKEADRVDASNIKLDDMGLVADDRIREQEMQEDNTRGG